MSLIFPNFDQNSENRKNCVNNPIFRRTKAREIVLSKRIKFEEHREIPNASDMGHVHKKARTIPAVTLGSFRKVINTKEWNPTE